MNNEITINGQLYRKVEDEPLEPEQWEPAGGGFYISCEGNALAALTSPKTRKFGAERKTIEAAERARDAMRTHNRILAYVEEYGGDWEADWSDKDQDKCAVYYSYWCKKWCIENAFKIRTAGAVYMSEECAEELVKKLNSGEVLL